MLVKSALVGTFLWRVDEDAVFAYGGEDAPSFFHINADLWEDMGKPKTITILVTPGDTLNSSE